MKKKIIYILIVLVLLAAAAVYYFKFYGHVSWSKAQGYFQMCQVKEVEKPGGSKVVLHLKTGRKISASEPKLNEVFAEIAKNFKACGPVFDITKK